MPTLPSEFLTVILPFASLFCKRVFVHVQLLLTGAILTLASEPSVLCCVSYDVLVKLDSKDKLKQFTLQLQNVQQWPTLSDASTMLISRPNGAARAVVLEALKGQKTLAQLSSEFGIHAQLITDRSGGPVETAGSRWDAHALRDNQHKPTLSVEQREQLEALLFQQIGQLKPGRRSGGERLAQKKIKDELIGDRRRLIEPQHERLSITQQCQLLSLPRSSYYYQPLSESAENLALMERIDKLFTERSEMGIRRMHQEVNSLDNPPGRFLWFKQTWAYKFCYIFCPA